MPSQFDRFNLVTDFELKGDQARAIPELVEGLERGDRHQVLLGSPARKDVHDGEGHRRSEPADARHGP
jgi:hypothetical protein